MLATQKQYVQWQENKDGNETLHQALWLSESNHVPPARIVLIDDKTTADEAYRLACEGTSLLWRGDFHNAKQLLQALNRRIERTNERSEQRKIKKAANQSAKSNKTAAESLETSKDIPNLFHVTNIRRSALFAMHLSITRISRIVDQVYNYLLQAHWVNI